MKKSYYIQYNIGRAKYALSSHDGLSLYPDGSPFFDLFLFKTKRALYEAIKRLDSEGYEPTL